MAEVDKILAERGKVHGPFFAHARISQRLKLAMCDSNYPHNLSSSQCEALDMIQHKIARILAGDPNHIDHWDDIAGYATLVANILRNQSTQAAERRSTLQSRATADAANGATADQP